MFESKYSKVLTVILIVVIIAIVVLLGFLAYDYIQKFNTTKQASDFVEDYQGDLNTGEQNVTGNDIENATLGNITETPIENSGTSGNGTKKKYYIIQ